MLNTRWFVYILKQRLKDFAFLFLLVVLKLVFHFDAKILLQILFLCFEVYFFNQFMSIRGTVIELSLRPVSPASFLILNNLASIVYLNLIYFCLGFIGHAYPGQEFVRLNLSLLVMLAAGNYLSNTKIVFRYRFLGMPVLRYALFGILLGLGFVIAYYVILIDSVVLYFVVFLVFLLALNWSICAQLALKHKHRLILMELQQNA